MTLLVAGPWTLFTIIKYPIEFHIENGVTFKHFTENLQGWGAPWYQVFKYNIYIFSSLTLLTLIATIYYLPRLFREKDVGFCLLYAWGLGVFPPFLIAVSKIPTATLMGSPALLLGKFVEDTTLETHLSAHLDVFHRFFVSYSSHKCMVDHRNECQ